MSAFLGTRKVRHVGVYMPTARTFGVGGWVPLCWHASRLLPETLWLGRSPELIEHTTDGNRRRSMRAAWQRPVCTRCLREWRKIGNLLVDDLRRAQ